MDRARRDDHLGGVHVQAHTPVQAGLHAPRAPAPHQHAMYLGAGEDLRAGRLRARHVGDPRVLLRRGGATERAHPRADAAARVAAQVTVRPAQRLGAAARDRRVGARQLRRHLGDRQGALDALEARIELLLGQLVQAILVAPALEHRGAACESRCRSSRAWCHRSRARAAAGSAACRASTPGRRRDRAWSSSPPAAPRNYRRRDVDPAPAPPPSRPPPRAPPPRPLPRRPLRRCTRPRRCCRSRSRPPLLPAQRPSTGDDGLGVPAQLPGESRIFVALHRQQATRELIDWPHARQQPAPTRTPSERDEQAHARTLGPRSRGDEAVERPGHDSEPTRAPHPETSVKLCP